jgi:alkyl hydroperoxide reductase subunit F
MPLDQELTQQLQRYLELLEGPVALTVRAGADETSRAMLDLVHEIASMSDLITVEPAQLPRSPSFRVGDRITFAGVPTGHEFTSLVLALLQVSGRRPRIDDKVVEQIKAIRGEYHFETYISLTCHNCPDVVQALNTMAVLNPGITHVMIDGAAFQEEATNRNIMAVPSVFLNGETVGSGRMTIEEILAKLGSAADVSDIDGREYDVLVIGGGPAGASAAPTPEVAVVPT